MQFETYRLKEWSRPINEAGDRYRIWMRWNHAAGIWEQRHEWVRDGKLIEMGAWINAHVSKSPLDDRYERVEQSEAA